MLRSELDHADQQLAHGEFSDYDETTILSLSEAVKTMGHARLHHQ